MMNFGIIVDLFALVIFIISVGAAVFAKDDLKEVKYLAWALIILLTNLSDNIWHGL